MGSTFKGKDLLLQSKVFLYELTPIEIEGRNESSGVASPESVLLEPTVMFLNIETSKNN